MLERRVLENGGLDSFALPFFAEVAELIETPWALSTGPDLAFPDTVGERPPDFEAQGKYFLALAALLPDDHKLNRQVTEVFHLARPLSELFDEPLKTRVEAKMQEIS
jgi:hypothetical protein